jgi:PEP-CTERM motif
MKFPLKATVAALALIGATPAYADIIAQKTSFDQGILVHTAGEEEGTDVTGTLGAGPDAPEIVHFTGSTDATGSTTDANDVHLQQGNGQAELTGAEFGGVDTMLQSGDIFLNDGGADNLGMTWIELAFTDVTADMVTFTLTLLGEPDFVQAFSIDHSPNGENKFGFQAINGESILNLNYAFSGGGAEAGAVRQVRIIPFGSAIPEPSSWAMMLLGFGAAGYALRRRRKSVLPQVA